MNIDLKAISNEMKRVIDNLSKYTHIEEGTFESQPALIDSMAFNALSVLNDYFCTIKEFREEIILAYEKRLYDSVLESLIYEIIQELDELSTHYWIEGCQIGTFLVESIDDIEINIHINGYVDVHHQYGSYGDIRRGDGLEISASYPFELSTVVDVTSPLEFNIETEDIQVDNSKFYA